jgi:hypothetical protein
LKLGCLDSDHREAAHPQRLLWRQHLPSASQQPTRLAVFSGSWRHAHSVRYKMNKHIPQLPSTTCNIMYRHNIYIYII